MDTSAAPAVADGDESITAPDRPDDLVMDDVVAAIGEVQVAEAIAGSSTQPGPFVPPIACSEEEQNRQAFEAAEKLVGDSTLDEDAHIDDVSMDKEKELLAISSNDPLPELASADLSELEGALAENKSGKGKSGSGKKNSGKHTPGGPGSTPIQDARMFNEDGSLCDDIRDISQDDKD